MMISCCRCSSILLVALLLPAVVEGFRSASPLVSVGQQQQQQQQHQDRQQRQRRSGVGPLFATGGNWNDLTTKLLTTPTNAASGGGTATATTEGVSTLIDTIQSLLQHSLDQGQLVLQHMNELFVSLVSSLTAIIPSSNINFDTVSSIQPLLDQFKQAVVSIGILSNDDAMKVIQSINTAFSVLNTPESIVVSAILSYVVINSVMTWSDSPPPGRPYPKGKYDPISARIYFDSRPLQVLARSVTITVKSLSFAMKLAQDKFIGGEETWQKNQEQRGLELAQLLTELGPTFIKIGQSLSIRADILSPAYIKGLSSLQDNVPAFDTATAIEILEEEWGVPVGDVLEGGLLESAKPVAAASLGQVYKAQLKGSGVEVAIKVQRPKITTQIALDMHLLREFAPIARRTFNLATDTEGTVDAWGAGFVDELDYLQEASNGKYFSEQILKTSLKDVVLAPEVIDEYTSGKVLVTGWVDGERLDRSSQEDVSVLCSICMNTYLSMMLEMGMLHCDPHPGNLLRTPDGKLCILDWGMVTTLPPGLQLTLLEHMAHLTSGDYAEVPRDLYLLGFVPADKEKVIEDSGVVDVLADIYGQWTSGGGMASINANDVLVQIQDLASTRGNLFQIPPYFAYIAKSFSVLEGIGLSNDSKYSIINECLPYISNRLLTDQDKMGNALNSFIFGPGKDDLDTRLIDINRIEQLVTGFGNFTASSASGSLSTPTTVTSGVGDNSTTTSTSIGMLEKQADQVLDIILTEDETPLQQILIEQLCKILAANTRSLWTEARVRSGVLPTGRTVLGTIVDPFGLFQTSPLVNADDQDERAVQTTKELIALLSSVTDGGGDGIDVQSLSNEDQIIFSRVLSQKLWERRSALIKSSNRFVNQLLQLTATRLETPERVPVGQRTPTVGVSSTSSQGSATATATATTESDESSSSNNNINFSKTATTSPRLQEARDRLNSLST